LILLRVPKRRQTLGAQKNQRHAPCPQKTNRTAVALCRPSTPFFAAGIDAKTSLAQNDPAMSAINPLRAAHVERSADIGRSRRYINPPGTSGLLALDLESKYDGNDTIERRPG
jgi:hypothetical protein